MSAALNSDHLLAVAFVAVAAILIMWDILVAGRVAQLRRAPRSFAAITAFAGLLLLPSVIVAYSAASILYGRAIQPISWIWPVTAGLCAMQAAYALSRRFVTPWFGVPVAVYNTIIAVVVVARYVVSKGGSPPEFSLALSAAQTASLGFSSAQPRYGARLISWCRCSRRHCRHDGE